MVADGSRLIGRDHLGDQAPHIWLGLWNQERDRLAKYSKMAVDAGVAEAQVRITANAAAELAAAMRVAFLGVGVDPGSELARQAIRSALSRPAIGAGEVSG